MNPYGIAHAPRIDLIATARWNEEISRSIDDYRRHPSTSCTYKDCVHLAPDGYLCNRHAKHNKKARDQMRELRRKVSHAEAQRRYRARKKGASK